MTEKTSDFGRAGEDAAADFLKKRGYRILKRNYRNRVGEIDIVAEEGKTLVFVEVKARAGSEFGSPLEALTAHKQRKLALVAEGFLASFKAADRLCRFDVVSIIGDPAQPKTWKIEVLADAFRIS